MVIPAKAGIQSTNQCTEYQDADARRVVYGCYPNTDTVHGRARNTRDTFARAERPATLLERAERNNFRVTGADQA